MPLSCLPLPPGHARSLPSVMSAAPFCHVRRFSPSVIPAVFSGNPVSFLFCLFIRVALHGKALDSRLKMSGMTRGELCVPAYPFCHACPSPSVHARSLPSVMPAGFPLLSCPPVLAGIQCFFSSVPSFVWPCLGKALDSRLKTSGMTERRLPTSGMTERRLPTSGMTEGRLNTSGMTEVGRWESRRLSAWFWISRRWCILYPGGVW